MSESTISQRIAARRRPDARVRDRILLVTELALPALRASLRAIEWMREEGIELESTVGAGSVFTVRLPYAGAPEAEGARPSKTGTRRGRAASA